MTRQVQLVLGTGSPFQCPDCGHDDTYVDEQYRLVVVHQPMCPALVNGRLRWHAENDFLDTAAAAGIPVADYGEQVIHEVRKV